jgi:hypothetical protein
MPVGLSNLETAEINTCMIKKYRRPDDLLQPRTPSLCRDRLSWPLTANAEHEPREHPPNPLLQPLSPSKNEVYRNELVKRCEQIATYMYAPSDKTLRVVHQEQGELSATRNRSRNRFARKVGGGGGLALGNALFENHPILNRAENHWTMQSNQGHGSALNDFVIGTQIRQRDVSRVGPVLSACWK